MNTAKNLKKTQTQQTKSTHLLLHILIASSHAINIGLTLQDLFYILDYICYIWPRKSPDCKLPFHYQVQSQPDSPTEQ